MPNPYSLSPVKPVEPGGLVVLGFADTDGAFALRDLLADMEEESVIDDAFMKKLGETPTPGSSALFVVVGQRKREEMESRRAPFAGKCKVLQTSLPAENEASLRRFMVDELPNSSNVP